MKKRLTIGFLAALLLAPATWAAELRVMISGGLQAPFEALVPLFEQGSGHKVLVVRGPSMGETPQAIPNRIARGEPVDVVIMVGDALGALASAGRVEPGSRVDVANSRIALAVKAGDAKPDISSVDALKAALLQARSVAWSDSASGVYIQNTLLPRLGLAEALKGKGRMIPAEPVARVVARGEAQLGFQQLSELKAVPGIEIVGLLPDGAQKVTVFSAGIATAAQQPQAGRELIAFLMSERARGVIAEAGLEPLGK